MVPYKILYAIISKYCAVYNLHLEVKNFFAGKNGFFEFNKNFGEK